MADKTELTPMDFGMPQAAMAPKEGFGLDSDMTIEKFYKEENTCFGIGKKYNIFTSFFVSKNTKTYYYSGGMIKKVSPDEKRDM